MLYYFLPLSFALSVFIPQTLIATPSLAHRLHNAEVEIEMLKKSIESQEESRASLDHDMRQLMKRAKTGSKEQSLETEKRLQSVEKQMEKVIQDIKEFKNHSNDLSKMLQELNTCTLNLEKKIEAQSTTIETLEKALRSLTMAFKGELSGQKEDIHIVQGGESLDKIAKKYKTSIQSIKELNGLISNTIRPGKELRIPPSKE